MMVPPSVLRIRVRDESKRLSLWIPLFLLWPLLLIFGVLLAPLIILLAVVLAPRSLGRPVLLLGPTAVQIVCA